MNFLSEVSRAVEASKSVISVDQPHNEGDTILGPSGVVDKSSKDELGILMRWGLGRDYDQDNEERYE